ncbi:LOW QUALITY PROTEIN: hypothetical protein V2J09_005827, partial [Rumex salicifolius]
ASRPLGSLGNSWGFRFYIKERLRTTSSPSSRRCKLGWKSRTLAMAGRITLTRFVLASLPVYTMQTLILPTSICDHIDNIYRNFIWGCSETSRNVHLVVWDDLCKPKSWGTLPSRKGVSHIWKGIVLGYNLVITLDLKWNVVFGCTVEFWSDRWLGDATLDSIGD